MAAGLALLWPFSQAAATQPAEAVLPSAAVSGAATGNDTTSLPPPSVLGDPRRQIFGPAASPRPGKAQRPGSSQLRTAAPAWGQKPPPPADPELHELGKRIYLEGRRPDGSWVRGVRYGHVQASGHAVACVMCHRRSGLGAVEGTLQIPPISGRYLYEQDARALVHMNLRSRKSFNQRHDPYTTETLSAALLGGVGIGGAELNPVMPRFELNDRDVRGLETYLRHLSSSWSPGVTTNQIRFATVITPDVDPARRKVFLDTLKATISQKNGSFTPGQRLMSSAAEMVLQTQRFWELDVWELKGPASTWDAQLRKLQAERPAFALVSGLGKSQWKPVHDFCEREGIPGWFPSLTQAPAESEDGFYNVYFSRGTALEAEVLTQHWQKTDNSHPKRVLQLVAPNDSGRSSADHLRESLRDSRIAVEQIELTAKNQTRIGMALMQLHPDEAVVIWAEPDQLPLLDGIALPPAQIYFSASMAGGERAPYPAAWKSGLKLIYPYELPEKRKAGLSYFKIWLKTRKLELTHELLQSEVYFAMDYLNDTVTEMLDNLHRDYLLERAENMLSWREGARAEEQARDLMTARQQVYHRGEALRELPYGSNRLPRPMPHKDNESAQISRRESTTVYPRLSLAQQQRLASKGAYIVRFTEPHSTDVTPVSDWITP
jgi:hypothetical protein